MVCYVLRTLRRLEPDLYRLQDAGLRRAVETLLGLADAFCRGEEVDRRELHVALNRTSFDQQPVSSVAYCAGHMGWGIVKDDPGRVARECYGLFRQLTHMTTEMRREYDALLRLRSSPKIDPSEDGPLGPLWTVATRITGPISIWNDLMTDDVFILDAISRAKQAGDETPGILLQAVIVPGERTHEGVLVEAVAVPWFEIMEIIAKDPDAIYEFDWRRWEEIVAGAYREQGFEVVLTPRSGDGGRDIIATSEGHGSIRILDQVKAYKPGHLVTADEVRSMLGTLSADLKASKGIITTTSDFAPRIETDERISKFLPTRLELRPRNELLDWLASVAKGQGS
ncbi:MAG: restriction endonuclease [Gemmatimonadetes bacterium]|nr:restriction endonuclease [Gemmatimonadota bacterium]MCH8813274.1 restriction endonuclease [Gemmatimonadota bacterium]